MFGLSTKLRVTLSYHFFPTEDERPYNAINLDYSFCLVQKKPRKESKSLAAW